MTSVITTVTHIIKIFDHDLILTTNENDYRRGYQLGLQQR